MGQSIGNRPLKKFFQGSVYRLCGSQVIVKSLQRGKKSLYFLMPDERLRFRISPLSHRHRERPVQQVPKVRQDLHRTSPRSLEVRELRRRVAYSLTAAVSQRRQGVAKKIAFRICL